VYLEKINSKSKGVKQLVLCHCSLATEMNKKLNKWWYTKSCSENERQVISRNIFSTKLWAFWRINKKQEQLPLTFG